MNLWKDMPSNVVRFEVLNYLSLVVGEVHFFIFQLHDFLKHTAIAPTTPHQALIDGLIFQTLVVGLTVLLVWLTARRHKNWPRWLFLISLVGFVPKEALYLLPLFRTNPTSAALLALIVILQGTGLYFVFTGNAREWFKRSADTTAGA